MNVKRFFGLILLFVFLHLGSADAFIGNHLLGEKWCVVGCGRGPLGIAPVGDLMKGANEFVFGPTLEAFETKGRNIIDYASKKADEKLLTLDNNIEAKLRQLSELTQDAVTQLDGVLSNNINVGLEGLQAKIAALDILGSRKTDDLNRALRGIVILASFSVFAVWIGKYISTSTGSLESRVKKARWRIGGAFVTLAVIAIAPHFIPSLQYQIPLIRAELDAEFDKEYRLLNFKRAAYIAEQLTNVAPDNNDYQYKKMLSELLRDVYLRPTTYKTENSLILTEYRLTSMLWPDGSGETNSASQPPPITKQPEVEITLAMIMWQVRTDALSRFQSAMISAAVLERELAKPVEMRSPFLPLAAHYVRAYLVLPLDRLDTDAIIPGVLGDKTELFQKNYPARSTVELVELLKKASPALTRPADSMALQLLAEQISFSDAVGKTYAIAIPSYVRMVKANSMLAIVPTEQKAQWKAERDSEASKVVAAWNELLRIIAVPSSSLTMRMALVTALHSTYTRAKLYAGADESGNIPPAVAADSIATLPVEMTFHDQWLREMAAAINPSGLPVLRFRVRAQFLIDQKNLAEFEDAFKKSLTTTPNKDLAINASNAAAKLGLFVCSNQSAINKDRIDLIDCDQPSANKIRALWYIRSLLPVAQQTDLSAWKGVAESSLKSAIPML
ncbi:hypothetical protein [Caballeronia sp. dw_276]|uniref:hypothetical protein n=1 Tax=Caballeronia sp. dw_276 TaxID=2719795 RepID=UPI001BD65526|nr:hypothetical protein [Caballeronia sp. dw_276]